MTTETALSDLLPTADLRVRAGDLELVGVTDDVLPGLVDLVRRGVHPPDAMPFYVPWTQAPPEQLAIRFAQHHWSVRAAFSPAAWDLQLAVRWRGRLVGVQGVVTRDYLVTRTGETGSWLGAEFQGRGLGTAMRRALCALLFDHLGAEEVTSGAFVDNPASLGVSRRVGYEPDGTSRIARTRAGRVEQAEHLRLVLTPERFDRGDEPIAVEGLEPLRRAIGLGDGGRVPG